MIDTWKVFVRKPKYKSYHMLNSQKPDKNVKQIVLFVCFSNTKKKHEKTPEHNPEALKNGVTSDL